jgi:hypothetical protein
MAERARGIADPRMLLARRSARRGLCGHPPTILSPRAPPRSPPARSRAPARRYLDRFYVEHHNLRKFARARAHALAPRVRSAL